MIILGKDERGEEIDCDLATLIESIRIAPGAPPCMRELVSEVCRRFELNAEVKFSSLDDPPPLQTVVGQS